MLYTEELLGFIQFDETTKINQTKLGGRTEASYIKDQNCLSIITNSIEIISFYGHQFQGENWLKDFLDL